MLPSASSTRLTGLNRGPAGLLNPAAPMPSLGYRPRLTPGAASPAPAPMPMPSQVQAPGGMVNPATAPPMGVSPAPMTPTPTAPAPMPAAQPPAPTLNGVSVSGIDPTNDLRNSTIAPTNAVDRYSLASDRLKNYDQTALPEFQHKLRDTVGANAGMGRLYSGQLNTSVGDLTRATENDRNSYFGNLLNDATQGTITDAANNRNELRTERGNQTAAEQSAFDRSRQGVMDTEALTNSGFNRDLARTQTGFANDPSALIAQLSAMSGANAQAGAAGVGASSANQSYIDMLKKILAGMNGGGATPAAQVPAAMGQ